MRTITYRDARVKFGEGGWLESGKGVRGVASEKERDKER